MLLCLRIKVEDKGVLKLRELEFTELDVRKIEAANEKKRIQNMENMESMGTAQRANHELTCKIKIKPQIQTLTIIQIYNPWMEQL